MDRRVAAGIFTIDQEPASMNLRASQNVCPFGQDRWRTDATQLSTTPQKKH